MAAAFGAQGWAPPMAISALVAHGAPSAPRDPGAAIMAVGAAAWLATRGGALWRRSRSSGPTR
eukprot:13734455-Alexandrium_andersonii.AAC.1